MDIQTAATDPAEARDLLLREARRLVPVMQARATVLDEHAAFPDQDFADLREVGALLAPFPRAAGGLGLGTEPEGAAAIAGLLRLLGQGHVAVGRLYEAHVNAVRLVARFATPDQVARAFADAATGGMFGLWVTDPPNDALRADAAGTLHGGKAFCSGAGHVGHAVVTATDNTGTTRLAYLATSDATATPLDGRLQGVRAAKTGRISFEGCRIEPDDWIGADGDYLREPDFSAGAWRTSAVTSGALQALVEAAMRQLLARGRADDPHQLARMGSAWIASETAALWTDRAARAAEGCDAAMAAADVVATVNLARIAIETACLDAMTLAERSLGLAAFIYPNPVERMRRDLATYLRQPAPDAVLTEAAAHIMRTAAS